MADTYLNMINSVLRRLREDEVSNWNDTSYSKLIGEFVNQAKQDMENFWDWQALRSNVSVTLQSDGTTTEYALTGTNKRTRVTAVYNNTQDYQLRIGSNEWINRNTIVLDDISGDPLYYNVAGIDSSEQLKLKVYPASEVGDTLAVSSVIPEDELTANADVTVLPGYPIILKAYALAVSERGEDGGVGVNEADAAARIARGEALLQDQKWFPDELTWFPE
jgi:hypothetical protein